MIGQKLLIDAVIKALGKKSKKKMEDLEKRVEKLEDNSHPKRDFIVCDRCKETIKEKWYDK